MEKHIFLVILLFLIQFNSLYTSTAASSNQTDQDALLAFQNLIVTSPTSHFLANNWTKNTSFCSWFGVTCSPKRQRVVSLSLPNLQLQGTIFPSLTNLSFLRELNLGNNSFRGSIPYGIGHLPRLRVVDIQSNQLQGSIPTSLFQNQKVQKISLAFNEFSGELWNGPWYVSELKVLHLRNNSLTGVIPPSVGNATELMNFSLSGNRINGNIPTEIGNLSQLAFLNLVDNELTGSSGSVYKGTLSSGTVVAIKVLDLENEEVCRRFDTECEVLRNVRHRNLVPVITTCSSDRIRAFVLQYMSNGSVENWLYRGEPHLNLLQRITIMLDVAVAIEYLHHGNDTPIVHCDLKPANILLDEDMVAHVGDFGISKILAVSKSIAHTETLGTLGYIAPGILVSFFLKCFWMKQKKAT